MRLCAFPYIHCCVDLSYGLIIQGELVDLDTVADQLTHDFDLELVQLALTDGVCFCNHWDDVHLQQDRIHLDVRVPNNAFFYLSICNKHKKYDRKNFRN